MSYPGCEEREITTLKVLYLLPNRRDATLSGWSNNILLPRVGPLGIGPTLGWMIQTL